MDSNNEILILNTGGTFNKYYDPIKGELKVSSENNFLIDIFKRAKISNIKIDGILYKDSLEIDDTDRQELKNYLLNTPYKKVIIVHGTDTMDISAQYIADELNDKTIIFTGAMKPYSIESVEAVSNLMIAYGYLLGRENKGIFISMHGMVKAHTQLVKNRKLGIFECQN